jgi:hypothetical protein
VNGEGTIAFARLLRGLLDEWVADLESGDARRVENATRKVRDVARAVLRAKGEGDIARHVIPLVLGLARRYVKDPATSVDGLVDAARKLSMGALGGWSDAEIRGVLRAGNYVVALTLLLEKHGMKMSEKRVEQLVPKKRRTPR